MDSVKARIVANHIQAGVVQKDRPEITVDFRESFVHPPVVVITPAWTQGAVYPETLKAVSRDSFTLYSGDAHPDYYVHWIAVGDIEG